MNSSSTPADQPSFFDQEVARISHEIAMTFEEALAQHNALNRQLEEAGGMNKEWETIAAVWHSFHEVMRGLKPDLEVNREAGIPGTGRHISDAQFTPKSSAVSRS